MVWTGERMRQPLFDLAAPPTVKITKLRGTVARHISYGLGLRFWKWRFWIVILSNEIRLGNWKFKDIHPGMKHLADEELTITALNEEYLHEALCHAAGPNTSKKWDNFPFDLRAYINGSQA